MSIFELSPYVDNQFKKSPELNTLLNAKEFDLKHDWQTFRNNHKNMDVFALCRHYRQSRLALIAARDINSSNPEDHINTLKLTSQLANLLITHVYQFAMAEISQKYGNVVNAEGKHQDFIIFTLGKLGGKELNYSSDVDLIFCYTGPGVSDGKKSIDAQEYFQKLGRRIIQILDSVTIDGRVYRVDMRLRPFGSAAPLVCSAQHLLNYLETEGRDWERYAWLRAGFIANNHVIAQSLLQDIEPFIYRKYLDYNIFESLRQIKAQIIRMQSEDLDNLKLGIGGIREIEFIIQTLQLTFGGRNKQLRSNDLWQQMHKLNQFDHLKKENFDQLTSAWLFLRKLENLCQIIEDRDTHHLPPSIDKLAECMHFTDEQTLLSCLHQHKNNVHRIFKLIFLENKSAEHNQHNPRIQKIKDEVSQRSLPKTSKHKIYAALDALVPFLNNVKENNHQDDLLIERYQQVINSISKRPSYLSMLIESPLILRRLIQQLKHSQYFSQSIAKNPSLLEVLFDEIDENDFDIQRQWRFFCQKRSFEDAEHFLEALCQFKQHIQFKAVMAYIDDIHGVDETQNILTKLAEKILSLVIKQAWKETIKDTTSDIKTDDLIIIAYGSLAMSNMHLNSDFDVVFILNQTINDDNHRFIMRWIKRIILLLSIPTYSGSLYQLDTQLRPNGKSGATVISQNNFENYQRNNAWTWEHAALIKSRAVYATTKQKEWFSNLRENILCKKRDAQQVDQDLKNMADKLNHMGQKNHQSEFDYLGHILKNAHSEPALIQNIYSQKNSTQHKLDQSIHQA